MNSLKIFILLSVVVFLATSCPKSKEQKLSNPQKSIEPIKSNEIETENRVEEKNYRADEILVKFRDHVTEKKIIEISKNLDLKIIKIISPPNLYLLRIRGDLPMQDLIKRLKQYKEVEYSEPNYIRKAF